MSTRFSAKINLWNGGDDNKTKAFATLLVHLNDSCTLSIDGFTIIEGAQGPFVGFPQGKPYDKDGKKVYPRTTRFLEEREQGAFAGPVEAEAKDAILLAYADAVGGTDRQAAARGQTAPPQRSNARPETPKAAPAGW